MLIKDSDEERVYLAGRLQEANRSRSAGIATSDQVAT